MASPVVSGTIALMLQANPALTPNLVKAILQFTAESRDGYDTLTQGAGFLNAVGAVRLAHFFATAQPGQRIPLQKMWSKKIIWGNHRLSGGILNPTANAYKIGTTWGATATDHGDNIVWGTTCSRGCDNIVWGTDGRDTVRDNIVWGTDGRDNIVWGTNGRDNIVWGTVRDGQIVWSTAHGSVSPLSWRELFRLTDEQIFTILRTVMATPQVLTPQKLLKPLSFFPIRRF